MTQHTKPAAIVVEDVDVWFGGLHALDQVSMTIPRGKVTGLIGPNGAGKSTLVNAVTGHVTPSGGKVLIDGQVVNRESVHRRAKRGVARTFQTPRLMPQGTVLDNLVIGAYATSRSGLPGCLIGTPRSAREERAAHDKAAELLDRFDLARYARSRAEETPLWALRLAEVARALMSDPSYVLLDEPAAGTDEAAHDLIETAVLELARNGIGVLLIEHHFAFVQRTSDHVVVLHDGALLVEGKPAAIAADPLVMETYLGKAAS